MSHKLFASSACLLSTCVCLSLGVGLVLSSRSADSRWRSPTHFERLWNWSLSPPGAGFVLPEGPCFLTASHPELLCWDWNEQVGPWMAEAWLVTGSPGPIAGTGSQRTMQNSHWPTQMSASRATGDLGGSTHWAEVHTWRETGAESHRWCLLPHEEGTT